MTAATARWKRVLAVRSIQRQMAEVQLNRCEAELRNLVGLGDRISSIRHAAQPSAGDHDGMMLHAICELSSRLDSAQSALATPNQNAKAARDRQQRAVTAAKQRETAVEKLEISLLGQDAKNADARQGRTAIFRKPIKTGGVI